jgi:hypothetical protein
MIDHDTTMIEINRLLTRKKGPEYRAFHHQDWFSMSFPVSIKIERGFNASGSSRYSSM